MKGGLTQRHHVLGWKLLLFGYTLRLVWDKWVESEGRVTLVELIQARTADRQLRIVQRSLAIAARNSYSRVLSPPISWHDLC